jgi:eukaryotic-like serine/threonine-protein kinase
MKTRFAHQLVKTRLLDAEKLAAARAVVGDDEEELANHLIREGLLTRFQARQLKAGATSFHVDKYLVVDCLGRGGSSVVYKARHLHMPQRYVALKTLDHHDIHKGDEALLRFRREIEIVTRLDHPNIVRAYDVIRTRTQLYLVLEYVEGKDLGSFVKQRGRLQVEEAVDYVIQAAHGLAYAHKQGIIHRDLKPGNLLLTNEGVVKIADLGLARVYGPDLDKEDEGLTAQGSCLGTPEFMPPEQAEDSSKADPRSDLYSLGATLFHLLTGDMPVTGSSVMHRIQRLLLSPPKPLMDARPDVPGPVAVVVDRLRARNPAHRLATAEEVIAALKPYGRRKTTGEPAHWDGSRKAELVLLVLQGTMSAEETCQKHAIAPEEFERWRKCFVDGGRQAFEATNQLRDLHARIGTQAMEIETLKKQLANHNGTNGTAKPQ